MQFVGQRDLGLECSNLLLSGGLDLGFLPVDAFLDIRRQTFLDNLSNDTKTNKDKDLIPNPKHVSAWSGNQ